MRAVDEEVAGAIWKRTGTADYSLSAFYQGAEDRVRDGADDERGFSGQSPVVRTRRVGLEPSPGDEASFPGPGVEVEDGCHAAEEACAQNRPEDELAENARTVATFPEGGRSLAATEALKPLNPGLKNL